LEENYRLDVRKRHSDVRPRPSLPRGHGFTRGRVFTVRRRGKNRVHADATMCPRERAGVRADMGVRRDAPPTFSLSLPPLPSPPPSPSLPSVVRADVGLRPRERGKNIKN
jgi:hypothetical protein